jgi:hypothetical protein
MKTYKKVQEVVETLDHIECDKCGDDIPITYNGYSSDWFTMRKGHGGVYGGTGTAWGIDLCEKCSTELIDLLKGMGYNIQEREYDW